MARQVRQTLPDPPATYDRDYMAALAKAVNNYMGQAQALGEVIAGHYIMTDPILVPGSEITVPPGQANTAGLPVGLVYLKTLASGEKVLSLVLVGDP